MPNWHYLRLPWCGYYRIWVYPLVCILKLLQLKFTAIYLWFSLSLLKSIFESTWVNLSLPIFNMAKLESTFESTWIFLSLLYCNLPLCQLELTTWVYLWNQQCHWSRLWHSQSFQRPPGNYFDNENDLERWWFWRWKLFGKMMILTMKIIWKEDDYDDENNLEIRWLSWRKSCWNIFHIIIIMNLIIIIIIMRTCFPCFSCSATYFGSIS